MCLVAKQTPSPVKTSSVWPTLKEKVQTKYSSLDKMKCLTRERRGYVWTLVKLSC